ncbi:MAG: radical SAM protein, partial [Candidatus Omnitrophica bacterium]|nr:radical SAM protein [Candidatus Omnitrophota bacterium]
NQCHCRCYFCGYADNSLKDEFTGLSVKDELSFEDVQRIVDQLPRRSVITFTGGEPVLAKDFYHIVAYAAQRHKVQVMTSGAVLNREKILQLIDAGIWIINFSLDVPVREIHDSIRGQAGLFEKVTDMLRQISALKRSGGLNRPLVHVNTVVLKESIPLLPRMVTLCSDLGVNWLSFAALKTGNGLPGYGLGDLIDLEMKLKESIALAAHSGLILRVGEELERTADVIRRDRQSTKCDVPRNSFDPSAAACYAPWTSLFVSTDGTARICSVILGNIRDSRIKELWNNQAARAARRNIFLGQDALPSECQGCCLKVGR